MAGWTANAATPGNSRRFDLPDVRLARAFSLPDENLAR
jgi:hypothetical protein